MDSSRSVWFYWFQHCFYNPIQDSYFWHIYSNIMFNKIKIWSESNFHSHRRRKNIHESISKWTRRIRYYFWNFCTIHSKVEWPRRASKMHARCQSTYYVHCCQLTTKFMAKSCESNKLHNQQNFHKMEPVENTFWNGYISTIELYASACLWL